MQQSIQKEFVLYKQCDSCKGYSYALIEDCAWFCPYCDKDLRAISSECIKENVEA